MLGEVQNRQNFFTGLDAATFAGPVTTRGADSFSDGRRELGVTSQTRRPRVLAVLPAFIPSTVLTVVKPLTSLHGEGRIVADITLESLLSSRQVERADVVVFSRNTSARALDAALAHRKPFIYDIDDDLFEIPRAYESALGAEEAARLERYLASADLVRAYSERLAERVRRINPRACRVDCAVDWSLVPQSPPERDNERVRIVYATSRWQEDELASLFMDDLRRLLREYAGRVEVFFWGYQPPELRGARGVRMLDFVPNYDKFFRAYARAGFDIGLAPLRDDAFHRSKCNNKFREFAACWIAGVYSDVEVYSSCVREGRTGLLVSGERGSWFGAVSRLVEDAALRRGIQEEAFRFARERYRLEKTSAVWLAHIEEVLRGERRVAFDQTNGADFRMEGAREKTGARRSVNSSTRGSAGVRAAFGLLRRAVVRCLLPAARARGGGLRGARHW